MSRAHAVRVLLAAATTTAALFGATGPAAANVGAAAGTDGIDPSRPQRAVTPAVQLILLARNPDLRTRSVAWACEAVALGDAAATRLTDCVLFVNGTAFRSAPLTLAGPGVASANATQMAPVGASVHACVVASAVWTDGTLSRDHSACTQAQVALA